jgi:CHAD domain-containing protein
MTTTTAREVERKYDAPTGEIDWAALDRLGRASEPVVDELVATYFDTADQRLLRAKVTMRHRSGGPDAGWHLKLPAGPDARDEIRLPDDGGGLAPPAEFVALTRSRTRGAELAPVATLSTTRRRRHWTDEAGHVAVELVDDLVSARRAGGGGDEWRELEVELGPGADAGLLDDVEATLLAAGAQRSGSASKLARALGPPPARPAPPVLKPRTPVGDVALAYVAAQAAALVDLDPHVRQDAHDAVHKMRVATRRMRSALQAFGREIDREATRPLTDELKWLAGVLGEARDLEVLAERVAIAVAALPPEDVLGPVQARVTKFFAARQRAARANVAAALDGDRYLALLAAVDALLADPPRTKAAKRKAGKALPNSLARAQRRVERHLAAAADETGEARHVELHEARKAAKRVRYAAEAAAPVLGERAQSLVEAAVDFQDLLGDHQDAVVTRPVVRELALEAQAANESAFTFGALYGTGVVPVGDAELDRRVRALRKAARRAIAG